MKSLQILILEDDPNDMQNIINLLAKDYNITIANTLQKAKDLLSSSHFDMAILDVNVEGNYEGLDFAKHIFESSKPIPFLFLTSMQSRTIFDKAKLTNPFTYLLKPFNPIELQYSIELALEGHFKEKNTLRTDSPILTTDYLLIKKQSKICKVALDTIEYIEVEENYCSLYTTDHKYVVKKSLSAIKDILTGKNFEQVHRKFVINFDKISEINLSDNTVYLSSGFQVTISERYKKQLSRNWDIIN